MKTEAERLVLPNGLPVYGATVSDVRLYQFIRGYFDYGIPLWPGMTVVDVGANIGLFALEVLQRCAGNLRLLAFEPAPASFAHLERNVGELFPESAVQLFPCALAACPGEATFYYRPRAPVLSSLSASSSVDWRRHADAVLRPDPPPEFRDVLPGWFRRIPRAVTRLFLVFVFRRGEKKVIETRCMVKTLSQIIDEQALETIDFLKVDVEGAELEVLRGIAPSDWARIRAIAAEVHDVDGRVSEVHGLLKSAGFRRVVADQEWILAGTDVYMVVASRYLN